MSITFNSDEIKLTAHGDNFQNIIFLIKVYRIRKLISFRKNANIKCFIVDTH